MNEGVPEGYILSSRRIRAFRTAVWTMASRTRNVSPQNAPKGESLHRARPEVSLPKRQNFSPSSRVPPRLPPPTEGRLGQWCSAALLATEAGLRPRQAPLLCLHVPVTAGLTQHTRHVQRVHRGGARFIVLGCCAVGQYADRVDCATSLGRAVATRKGHSRVRHFGGVCALLNTSQPAPSITAAQWLPAACSAHLPSPRPHGRHGTRLHSTGLERKW